MSIEDGLKMRPIYERGADPKNRLPIICVVLVRGLVRGLLTLAQVTGCLTASASAAAGVTGAVLRVRTTDTSDAFLFLLDDVSSSTADNQADDKDYDNINCVHTDTAFLCVM